MFRQGHFDRKGLTWDTAEFSQVSIYENHLQWKAKLKQASAQSLNHQLSATTALAFGESFLHIQCLQVLLMFMQSASAHRGEREPWQRGECCYLQAPFLKNAYISYSALEAWQLWG